MHVCHGQELRPSLVGLTHIMSQSWHIRSVMGAIEQHDLGKDGQHLQRCFTVGKHLLDCTQTELPKPFNMAVFGSFVQR